jgi:hypothetical protein
MFRLQHSTKRNWAAIGDIGTIQCMLYYKLCAKYSAHPPVYAIWTVVPNIYNVLTDPHIQDSIFSWTYLRCYRRYVYNSASLILQPWCQYCAHPPEYAMWTVVSAMYSIITAPHIRATIFNWRCLRCQWRYIDNLVCAILQTRCQIQGTSSTLRYLNCGP